MKLVSLDAAKKMQNWDHNFDDWKIDFCLNAASAAVIRYLKSRVDEWLITDSAGDIELDEYDNPMGVPYDVQCATIMLAGWMLANPDGDPDKAFEFGYLPKPVMGLLYSLRDPAIA